MKSLFEPFTPSEVFSLGRALVSAVNEDSLDDARQIYEEALKRAISGLKSPSGHGAVLIDRDGGTVEVTAVPSDDRAQRLYAAIGWGIVDGMSSVVDPSRRRELSRDVALDALYLSRAIERWRMLAARIGAALTTVELIASAIVAGMPPTPRPQVEDEEAATCLR